MTPEELEEELRGYLSRHVRGPGEAYEFNIKVRRLNIPDRVREHLGEERLAVIVQNEMTDALTGFVDWSEGDFGWISGWEQAGRGGGWLVFHTNEPVLPVVNVHGEVEDVELAEQRLKDLNTIDERIRRSIDEMERDFASPRFWGHLIPEFKALISRKHWDPRE